MDQCIRIPSLTHNGDWHVNGKFFTKWRSCWYVFYIKLFDYDFFLKKFGEVDIIDYQDKKKPNKNKKIPKTLCPCFDNIECKYEIASEKSDHYSASASIGI